MSNWARRRFTEKLTVQVSPDQLARLRKEAARRGLTQSEMLRALIDSFEENEAIPKAFLMNGAHE